MIEIQSGWTAPEAFAQNEIKKLNREIESHNKKLEEALERRAELQAKCQHNHVKDEKCEVCGVPVK